MNQKQFWNLPEVREQQEIQKRNPHGSEAHQTAYIRITKLLVEKAGKSIKEAHYIMGDYWS